MRRLTSSMPPALLALLLLTAPAFAADTPKPRTIYRDGPSGRHLVDGTWYRRADPQDQGMRLRFQRSASLSGWTRTSVPNAANAGDFSAASYSGSVQWYRKDFKAPRAGTGSQWVLRFESVNYRAKVWLNGKPLGAHVGAYLPFELKAKGLKARGVNRLVVRVDGRRQRFDIPPLSIKTNGQFEGGWWNYTGILREVYLRRITKLDLVDAFVEPRLRCPDCAARVTVHARVENVTGHGRRVRLSGSFGNQTLRFKGKRVRAHGSARLRAKIRVAHPRLWSPERPSLYTARLKVSDDSAGVVQRYTVHTGIRTLRVDSLGRIELNGRDLNLRGASLHEDNPRIGAALGRSHMQALFGYLRQLGANITRSHYPLHPYLLELADRHGVLVWSEIPVFRMKSKLFNIAEVRDKALRMLRKVVTRDHNHPSIAVWSIGNENASRPKRGLRNYILRARRTVKQMDPTRLIGIATSGYPSVEKQPIYTALDVIGVNDYFGWYTGPRGTIADRAALSAYLDRLHRDYPNQAFVITEVGAEANRPGSPGDKGTFQFQSDFLKYHFDVLAQKPFINAALVWILRDFRVKPGWAGGNPLPTPPVNQKGLVDDGGRPKPAFWVVRDIFRRTQPFR